MRFNVAALACIASVSATTGPTPSPTPSPAGAAHKHAHQHAAHKHATDGAADDHALRSEYLGFFRDTVLNGVYNPHDALTDGHDWPPNSLALSMAGQRRLDSFAALVATAVEDGVPGHVIETGVWRGGAACGAWGMGLAGPGAAW